MTRENMKNTIEIPCNHHLLKAIYDTEDSLNFIQNEQFKTSIQQFIRQESNMIKIDAVLLNIKIYPPHDQDVYFVIEYDSSNAKNINLEKYQLEGFNRLELFEFLY